MGDEMVTISKARLEQLEAAEARLEALEGDGVDSWGGYGVDNWEGYDLIMEKLRRESDG